MNHTEIAYFGVILFCALAALNTWKRRHDQVAARLNRGLSSYMCGNSRVAPPL
jgi:hypothetical protein